MAVQGQTMIAASGDSGSEDCYPVDPGPQLAVDDPGSQPDVLSVRRHVHDRWVGRVASRSGTTALSQPWA